jgi:hypothetical protein
VALAWSTDVQQAAWLAGGVEGFARDVGSILPRGYERYARILHPLEEGPAGAGPTWLHARAGSRTPRCSST